MDLFPSNYHLIALILLCIIKAGFIQSSAQVICPIELHSSFTDLECNTKELSSHPQIIYVHNRCQFILDGLYRVSCDADSNSLHFEPCFATRFIKAKSYLLNSCFENINPRSEIEGTHSSFIGSCTHSSFCPTSSPTETLTPTAAPTPEFTVVAHVDLPSPPIPPNGFADQPLEVSLAHEVVYLAGKLIYQVQDDTTAASLLPENYSFHLWKDTGSTEVLVISTDHENEYDPGKGERGKIMVIFRGTDETPDGDWLTNINLPKVRFGPDNALLEGNVVANNVFGFSKTYEIRVHRGFNGVFSDGLYEIVMSTIKPLLEKTLPGSTNKLYYNSTIHFGGHSLGGANAQLFGTYFAYFHPHVKTYVTTLGAPRQGNYAYKILVESLPNLSVWRMVKCRDVVPRVPNLNYYHAGHLIWQRCNRPQEEKLPNGSVEAYYRQSGDEEQQYSEVPQSFVISSYEATMVSDHFGSQYLQWLEYARISQDGGNWSSVFEPLSNDPLGSNGESGASG